MEGQESCAVEQLQGRSFGEDFLRSRSNAERGDQDDPPIRPSASRETVTTQECAHGKTAQISNTN